MTAKHDNTPIFDFKAVFNPEDDLCFYEDILTEERTEREVDSLTHLLALDRPLKILDLACGHGRHSNLLARAGHDVTGVDLTEGFLTLARTSAEKLGVEVTYVRSDMREISYTNEFDRVLLLYTSFGYFNDDDNARVLKNVFRALKPGGVFCFDGHNRDITMKDHRPYFVKEKGEDLLIDRITFDSETGRMTNRRIMIRNGVRKDTPFSIRFYNPQEITQLLGSVGFEDVKIFGGYDGKPLSENLNQMVITAVKPSG